MNERSAETTARRVERVFSETAIVSSQSFRFGSGEEIDVASLAAIAPAPAGGDEAHDAPLRNALANALYFVAYARTYRGGAVDMARWRIPVVSDDAFVTALATANPSMERWEPGWRVFRADPNGAIHVRKSDSATCVQPGHYAFLAGAGRAPIAGDLIDLYVARQSLQHQPGTYYAFGEAVACDYDQSRLARFYFNAPSEHVAWLVHTLGYALNRYQVPFRLKCPVDPKHFDRSDGVVLYVARRNARFVLQLVRRSERDFVTRLRSGTPLFAAAVAHGVGAADEPGGGASFGQARSRLLADAIVDAWRAGDEDTASRQLALAARFRDAGLDASKPHVARGLEDIYTFAED